MATRSRIAIENKNGTIESIYCHWDGYAEGVGKMLKKYYTKESKVRELINLGDISNLDKDIGIKQDFNNPIQGMTLVYGRDRGEKGVDAAHHPSFGVFANFADEAFVYIFVKNGWKMLIRNSEGYLQKSEDCEESLIDPS